MPETVYFSPEKTLWAVEKIAKDIEADSWQPELIFGLTRGGSVPATMLSHRLGLEKNCVVHGRDLYALHEYLRANHFPDIPLRVLIVDDICDSGKTFQKFNTSRHPNQPLWRYAVLINNTEQPFKPHYWGYEIQRSTQPLWYDFFWEAKKIVDGTSQLRHNTVTLNNETLKEWLDEIIQKRFNCGEVIFPESNWDSAYIDHQSLGLIWDEFGHGTKRDLEKFIFSNSVIHIDNDNH